MTALDRARAATARAHEREADSRRHHDWVITRPGEEPMPIHLQPAQDAQWVAAHYPGCAFAQGRK